MRRVCLQSVDLGNVAIRDHRGAARTLQPRDRRHGCDRGLEPGAAVAVAMSAETGESLAKRFPGGRSCVRWQQEPGDENDTKRHPRACALLVTMPKQPTRIELPPDSPRGQTATPR